MILVDVILPVFILVLSWLPGGLQPITLAAAFNLIFAESASSDAGNGHLRMPCSSMGRDIILEGTQWKQ